MEEIVLDYVISTDPKCLYSYLELFELISEYLD